MELDFLRENWQRLLWQLDSQTDDNRLFFEKLILEYSSFERHYHDLTHVQQLLKTLEEVKQSTNNYTAILLAIWFYDYVYNPQFKDNEIESAQLAVKFLEQLNAAENLVELVEKFILSTQQHQPLIDDWDCMIFLDADLSILGASTEKYWQYACDIRREYKHLGDRDYYQGRAKVLKNFLSRSRIYYTDYFYHKLEKQARANMKMEIKSYLLV